MFLGNWSSTTRIASDASGVAPQLSSPPPAARSQRERKRWRTSASKASDFRHHILRGRPRSGDPGAPNEKSRTSAKTVNCRCGYWRSREASRGRRRRSARAAPRRRTRPGRLPTGVYQCASWLARFAMSRYFIPSRSTPAETPTPEGVRVQSPRAPVAQWIEQPPPKGQVGRSIRLWGANHPGEPTGGCWRRSVRSGCLNLDQLRSARRSRLDSDRGFATSEVFSHQRNKLLIGLAVYGR